MTQTNTTQATPPSGRLGYQPALDGVRAIAVTLVALYHYTFAGAFGTNSKPFHGGFLGVDAFFVLSGFLITTLLLQEHASTGSVNLRHFYARRALRLLPAFGLLWITALVLHFTLGPRGPFRPLTDGLLGALFYVANWVSIYRPGTLGMIAHTWSLAIEEQFYFIWPIILIFLLRKRLRWPTMAVVTGAGAVAAAIYRAHYWRTRLDRATLLDFQFRHSARGLSATGPTLIFHRVKLWDRVYLGSDTRADALLAGCFTAIVLWAVLPRLGARARARLGFAAIFALAGAGVIVWRAVVWRSGWLPPWGFAALEVCIAATIAGLVAAPRAPLARLLSARPLVWIGRRSYAIYLFHIPVFLYGNRGRVHLSPPLSFGFQVGSVLVLAELSHRFVEAPMLRRKRHFESVPAPP